jgi:hypothetical protein
MALVCRNLRRDTLSGIVPFFGLHQEKAQSHSKRILALYKVCCSLGFGD